jgi:fructan beta-fructosidase
MKLFTIAVACCLCVSVRAQTPLADTVRQIKIAKGQAYLNLPVSEAGKLTRAKISVDGKVIDQFTIKFAAADPDYWVFFDVTPYQGKTLTLEISKSTVEGRSTTNNIAHANNVVYEDPVKALKTVYADAKFPGQDSLYKETLRPQVHFSSQRGWINDPNGLIYQNGEYHLFYQHNPYGWAWGNMHWGHAVSKDLIYWKQLPEAIYPFGDKDAAFSGSAVVDPKNTAGFRKNGIDPLIAVYTSTGRGECLKISYDNGRTFTDYEGNPVVKHSGRDPKVFWYEPGNHWVMVLWDNGHKKKMTLGQETVINQHVIYTSPDLKNWTYQSGVEGFFECPELFELPVEGEIGTSKWVIYDATGRYAVGDFNGKTFVVTQQIKQYDYGGGYFYASQTFNNAPGKRRIQVGWGRNITHAGMPFNQAMLFPVELTLKKSFDGLRLCPVPIKEISLLHKNSQVISDKVIKQKDSVSIAVKGDALHVVAEFEKGDAIPFGLNILGYEIAYNDLVGELTTSFKDVHSNTKYPTPGNDLFRIEAIVDKNILEVYINNGELYYTMPFDGAKSGKVDVFVKGFGSQAKSVLKKIEVHELHSIWDK